jgi:hypothetical protein
MIVLGMMNPLVMIVVAIVIAAEKADVNFVLIY